GKLPWGQANGSHRGQGDIIQSILQGEGQLGPRRIAVFGLLGQAAQDDGFNAWRKVWTHLAGRRRRGVDMLIQGLSEVIDLKGQVTRSDLIEDDAQRVE